MSLFSEARILLVENDMQLYLTETGKSQLVHPLYSQQNNVFLCCTTLNKMVMKRLFKGTCQKAEFCNSLVSYSVLIVLKARYQL